MASMPSSVGKDYAFADAYGDSIQTRAIHNKWKKIGCEVAKDGK